MPSARGTLDWYPIVDRLDLVAPAVAERMSEFAEAKVAVIDPAMADTAAFCEAYDVAPDHSANCVVVVGRRGGEARYAAVMVLATMRADINGVVRRRLDVRKCSFASVDEAVQLTRMEYGGITPLGLPGGWPVLVDESVAAAECLIIGSGSRRSKVFIESKTLLRLPSAELGKFTR